MAIKKRLAAKKIAPKKTAKKAMKKKAAKKAASKKPIRKKPVRKKSAASSSTRRSPAAAPAILTRSAIRSHAEDPNRPQYTGKQLVILNPDHSTSDFQRVASASSIKLASVSDFKGSSSQSNYHQAMNEADGVIFDKLKVAVVAKPAPQLRGLTMAAASSSRFLHSEPERFVYALHAKRKKKPVVNAPISYKDNNDFTWGIQAINVMNRKVTGKGINLAILDTGFTLDHPDFTGRSIVSKSFIDNQTVDDLNGHGTHCTGISAGGNSLSKNFQYGTAHGANIFIGKVLNNAGSGTDGSILAGIEWAIENKCHVVSMSLGGPASVGEPYSETYESAAKQALKNNCLLIAAAGNESNRDAVINPVDHPANCPSIMSIAAVDSNLKTAWFSCAGINKDGGQVDLTAPGVDIISSWKDGKYHPDSGTSMATPFVAGIAALLWEEEPTASASQIWMRLTQLAKRLNISSADGGSGLAYLP